MNEFIDDRGHLIEVVEHVTQIKIPTPWGPTFQPRTNTTWVDLGEATEEDRRRILRE